MTLFMLCVIFPTVVLSINYTNNQNNTSYQKNTVTVFLNESERLLNRDYNISNIDKNTQSTNKKIGHVQKYKKPKSKSKKKTKPNNKKQVFIPINRNLSDMPVESDLEDIFNALHKVLDFFLENKNDVDISVNYGLFLLNVNLKTVLKNKRNKLPSGIDFNLKHILEKNDELLTFFKKMVEQDDDPDDNLSKSLTNLFSHDRLWIDRIRKFNGSHQNETFTEKYETLEYRYSQWAKYLDNIGDFEKAQPRPDQSNQCLSFLAKNHASKDSWKKACRIPIQCKKPLAQGTDYGYGLTHRLLFLQLAYYGHRCFVFSNKKDEEMRRQFCKSLYSEATYISMNDYGAIDLFVEQLCLCALDGHFEFLRRSWLLSITDYQTEAGCFSDLPIEKRPRRPIFESALRSTWLLDKGENQYILGGMCNVHTSSAAAATLAFGVKFILETYY